MFHSTRGSILVLFSSLFFLLGPANGVPMLEIRSEPAVSIAIRASDGSIQQPVTVNTSNNVQTAAGMMTENCAITLTPFTSQSGESLVQETKACTLSNAIAVAGGAGNPAGASPPASGSAPASAPSASAPSAPASGAPASDSVATPSGTDSAASGAATAPAAPTGAPVISAGSVSFIPVASAAPASGSASGASAVPTSAAASASASAPASAPSSASSAQGSQSASNNAAQPPVGVVGWSMIPMPTGALATGTSAADTVQSSPAAFAVPGKKLQVLPVGLGIFAGITGITIIVVGLVTYERTKYRRAFRQRKLAEQGTAMGYGGMAQVA